MRLQKQNDLLYSKACNMISHIGGNVEDKQWHLWIDEKPPERLPVIIKRGDGPEEGAAVREELSPFFNIWGVRWRHTGISREGA